MTTKITETITLDKVGIKENTGTEINVLLCSWIYSLLFFTVYLFSLDNKCMKYIFAFNIYYQYCKLYLYMLHNQNINKRTIYLYFSLNYNGTYKIVRCSRNIRDATKILTLNPILKCS